MSFRCYFYLRKVKFIASFKKLWAKFVGDNLSCNFFYKRLNSSVPNAVEIVFRILRSLKHLKKGGTLTPTWIFELRKS